MKQEEKTEHTKERILAAALEEFGTYGYSAATINAICSKHNIPKGLLYHNFTGKDDLYLACIARCFNDIMSYLQNNSTNIDLKNISSCVFCICLNIHYVQKYFLKQFYIRHFYYQKK